MRRLIDYVGVKPFIFLAVVAINLAGAWLFGRNGYVMLFLGTATLLVPFVYYLTQKQDD